MAIIDQRILIPARQEVVWAYLSDLQNNAEWQADCRAVSFLSTKHTGAGTRWRSTTQQGRDAVLEITSWYNGLGYEYNYVDGGPFKENQGRVRLQEIPEGTVVQWTFSFESGGLFGGGRASRQVDSTMAASLKALYRQIKAFTKDQNEELVAKSLMREAPDVEARAAYKPRHPSALTDGAPAEVVEDAVLMPVSAEPAVNAGDATLVPAIDLATEPPVAVDDTKPREPALAVAEGDERFAPKSEPAEVQAPEAEPAPTAEPDTAAAVEPETATAEEQASAPIADALAAAPMVDRTEAAARAAAIAAVLPPSDSEGKSIWEVFGVQRPEAPAEESPKPEDAPSLTETALPEAETPPDAAIDEAATEAAPAHEEAPAEVAEVAETPAVAVEPEQPLAKAGILAALMGAGEVSLIEAAVAKADAVEQEPQAAAVAAPAAYHPRKGLRVSERQNLVALRRPM